MRQGVQEINFCRLPFFACVVFGLNKLKHPRWGKGAGAGRSQEPGARSQELPKTVIVPSALEGKTGLEPVD